MARRIFVRIRSAPDAATRMSQRSAPSPSSRNVVSSGLAAFGSRVERVGRPLRVVGGIDPGIAGCRQPVADNLSGAGRAKVDDDELLTVNPDPDPAR